MLLVEDECRVLRGAEGFGLKPGEPLGLDRFALVGVPDHGKIVIRPTGLVIRLPGPSLSRAGFAAVTRLVVRLHVHRAILDITENQEWFAYQSDLIARLDELCRASNGEPERAPHLRVDLALERIAQDSRRAILRGAVGQWRRSRGRLSRARLLAVTGRTDVDQTLLRLAPGGSLTIESVGTSWGMSVPAQFVAPLGQELDSLPNATTGLGVAGHYRDFVAHAEEPRLDMVELLLTESNGESYRLRADRLLLPWSDSSGGRWMSTQWSLRSRRMVLP